MAIKVGGTNVITDARALNNITSADAATVAALGNAGVGGSTSNLGDTSLSGTPSSFDITLDSGYDKHIIYIAGVGSNDYSGGVALQMSNSSGSMLSSGHSWVYFSSPNYTQGHTNADIIRMESNGVYSSNEKNTMQIVIIGARDSSRRTFGFVRHAGVADSRLSITNFSMNTVQQNTKIRVRADYAAGGYTLSMGSGAYYKKYGVK